MSDGLYTDQLLELLHGGRIAAQWGHLGQGSHNGRGCRRSESAVRHVSRVVHMAAGQKPGKLTLL